MSIPMQRAPIHLRVQPQGRAAQLFRLEDSLSRRSECDETTSQVGLRQRRTGVELQVLSGRRRSDLAFAPSTEAL